MRKLPYLLVLLVAIGIWGGNAILSNRQDVVILGPLQQAVSSKPVVPSPTPQATASIGKPKTLSIPKLGISGVAVEDVGLDREGRMDVPRRVNEVGWYELGFKPGDKGSAVIDGHFDTVTGAPAVFYYINQLKQGDQIIVKDEKGNELKFAVERVETYDFDKLPLQQIFASAGKSQLNLITCNGSWDRATKNYSKRMVVYAEGS